MLLFPAPSVQVREIVYTRPLPAPDRSARRRTFGPIFYWFVQASRLGRYSPSSTSSMEEDLKEVTEAASLKDALERLLGRIRYPPRVTADDFLRYFGDSRSGRLILYLLIQRNAAVDWDQREMRIGFDSVGLLSGFAPQFHHIFPKAFIGDAHPADLINALANIALIGPAINIRISKKNPMDYISRYVITLVASVEGVGGTNTPIDASPPNESSRCRFATAEI
jgi:hypothetical protein